MSANHNITGPSSCSLLRSYRAMYAEVAFFTASFTSF